MWNQQEQPEPTKKDCGQFLSNSELSTWHTKMKRQLPDIFPPTEPNLFGTRHPQQHTFDTKLMAHFDNDVTKPMRCLVKGSRWKKEYGETEPVYIVLINGELSQIALTSAH